MIRRTLDFTPASCFSCIHSYHELTTRLNMCGLHRCAIGFNLSTYVCDEWTRGAERREPVQLKLF